MAIKRAWSDRNRPNQRKFRVDAHSLNIALRSLQSASSALTSSAELRLRIGEIFFLLSNHNRQNTDGSPARDREALYLNRALEELDAALAIRPDYVEVFPFLLFQFLTINTSLIL